jgi:hypothetical protein
MYLLSYFVYLDRRAWSVYTFYNRKTSTSDVFFYYARPGEMAVDYNGKYHREKSGNLEPVPGEMAVDYNGKYHREKSGNLAPVPGEGAVDWFQVMEIDVLLLSIVILAALSTATHCNNP